MVNPRALERARRWWDREAVHVAPPDEPASAPQPPTPVVTARPVSEDNPRRVWVACPHCGRRYEWTLSTRGHLKKAHRRKICPRYGRIYRVQLLPDGPRR